MSKLGTRSKKQIIYHTLPAKKLGLINKEVYRLIRTNKPIHEKNVINFIGKAYKKTGLVNGSKKEFCIVAFGKNTKEVHYFPKGKGLKLKRNTLIPLDLWLHSIKIVLPTTILLL